MGDIGNIVQKVRKLYKRREIPFNYLIAKGVIGEYGFLEGVKKFFFDVDGHVFNNCRFNNETSEAGGVGLESYPDHLLLTRTGFLYVETKNWTGEYAISRQREIRQQIETTMRNIKFYFRHCGVTSLPSAVLYDAEGTIDANGICVIRDVSKLKGFLSEGVVGDYERMLEILGGLCRNS